MPRNRHHPCSIRPAELCLGEVENKDPTVEVFWWLDEFDWFVFALGRTAVRRGQVVCDRSERS